MKDFIELIKENANNFPDRVAVIDGERRISYVEFINLVNSISHYLIFTNPRPKVVFDLRQGIEAYALIVAVLNVGGTYCPLYPDAPMERKIQIVDEFAPDLIVIEANGKDLEFNSTKTVTMEKLLNKKNYTEIEMHYEDDSVIYVIYTSGTTGIPKGVMITRKALNMFLEWAIPTYVADESDVWGQYSFLSFDLSVVDIFTCLCSGATLFAMNDIPAKKSRPSGVIEKAKITIWHSIPSIVDFMIANEMSKTYDFSSLRLMSFCGEPLRKRHVEFLFKKKANMHIFNTYGPTEGTLFFTYQELTADNYLNYCDYTISIGKPIPGWNIKLSPFGDYDEKEVIIYGDYIGKGYLEDISDTKFNAIKIEGRTIRCFETGDLVTEKNNNLYFSCRKDRQVKIKGFRIELDEIDFRINEFLDKTSVTIVKKDNLYSFIEVEEEINKSELRKFLRNKLEPFKIPIDFYPIKEIPRTQNLKVNINALIEMLP